MSFDLRRLQLVQLEILNEIKRVCEENNITFYLACGSCLGAVRHNGFIPWDDDIDIFMSANDYDRFVNLSKKFNSKFFLQTKETDSNYQSMIARVRMDGTTIFEKEELNVDFHHGVFVDIYPLFGYPSDALKAKKMVLDSYIYRLLIANRVPFNHGRIAALIAKVFLSYYKGQKRDKRIQKLHTRLRKYNNTKYVATLYGMDVSPRKKGMIIYEREWFRNPVYTQFEDQLMPIATDVEAYLITKYGKNYMELPPKEKRQSYHSYEFVDLDNSFEKYKGIYY